MKSIGVFEWVFMPEIRSVANFFYVLFHNINSSIIPPLLVLTKALAKKRLNGDIKVSIFNPLCIVTVSVVQINKV